MLVGGDDDDDDVDEVAVTVTAIVVVAAVVVEAEKQHVHEHAKRVGLDLDSGVGVAHVVPKALIVLLLSSVVFVLVCVYSARGRADEQDHVLCVSSRRVDARVRD